MLIENDLFWKCHGWKFNVNLSRPMQGRSTVFVCCRTYHVVGLLLAKIHLLVSSSLSMYSSTCNISRTGKRIFIKFGKRGCRHNLLLHVSYDHNRTIISGAYMKMNFRSHHERNSLITEYLLALIMLPTEGEREHRTYILCVIHFSCKS